MVLDFIVFEDVVVEVMGSGADWYYDNIFW